MKLHDEECSPDIIRQIKSRRLTWAGHVTHMGEERKVYKVLVGKPEGKTPLGRLRRRYEEGIRMDLMEIGCGEGVWGGGVGRGLWSRSSWLRIEASGRLLYI
jgi:hypothetical protein